MKYSLGNPSARNLLHAFVQGRDARLLDVGIDMLGAALGIWIGRN